MSQQRLRSAFARACAAALVSAVGIVAPAVLGSGVAHAATPTPNAYEITQKPVTMTTSTGKSITVGLMLDKDPGGCADCGSWNGIEVDLKTPDKVEQHEWDFSLDESEFTLPSGDQPGTIDTRSTISPFGAVSLSLTPVGSSTTDTCGGKPADIVQTVTMSGSIYFDTKSSGPNAWGTIGSPTTPATFSSTAEFVTYFANRACDYGFDDCAFGSTWFASGSTGDTSFVGRTSSKAIGVTFEKVVNFTKPEDASRSDVIRTQLASAKLTRSGKHATIKLTGKGTVITGTATLNVKTSGAPEITCGTHKTRATDTNYSGTLKAGSKPLTVHPQIFGSASVKTGGIATLERFEKR